MEISIFASIIWVTAILIGSLDIVILMGSQNRSSKVFAALTFITAIWVASQGFLIITPLPLLADSVIRIQSILGIIIALGFYQFSVIYPYDTPVSSTKITLSIFIVLIFTYLFEFTAYLNTGVYEIGGNGRWAWTFGPLHVLFDCIFILIWFLSIKNIFRTLTKSSGMLRANMKTMLWALIFGIIPPTLVNIVLPTFGYYSLNWLGPISSAIWVFIIAYSILKYRQMDVRAVITEVLAIAMTAIFFINIFINTPWGVWEDVGTFIVFLILAIYLVRGTLRESKQREQLADLNLHLAEKVAEQTNEIRTAYDLEKEARRELEKLNEAKNQFIMITQHHLRTPVTTIERELGSMLDGDCGKTTQKLKVAAGQAQTATSRLNHIIDDFLNITTMKPGQNILTPSRNSLKPAIEEILLVLKTEIERRHITVSYQPDESAWPELMIDFGKMRDILLIIMENAITYNHDGGHIKISTQVVNGRFSLIIENSGIGISSEEVSKIGSTLFYRGENARKVNKIGMGVGLSVAKAIIKAHHGTFGIESDGKDAGARVMINLPISTI